jgi:hypothetical protein
MINIMTKKKLVILMLWILYGKAILLNLIVYNVSIDFSCWIRVTR